jgi:hypothetical protein
MDIPKILSGYEKLAVVWTPNVIQMAYDYAGGLPILFPRFYKGL